VKFENDIELWLSNSRFILAIASSRAVAPTDIWLGGRIRRVCPCCCVLARCLGKETKMLFPCCTALYRTQLPLIENSFNGCQGHPPLCLPPGTAQRLPDRIQKVFGRAAIYSANSSRWHKCKSGWSLKTERSIVNDMYTLILLIQYGIYFWHELAYTLSHFLKLNSNICGNPLAFSLTFDLQYYLNCT
jgi:hypothetical protein